MMNLTKTSKTGDFSMIRGLFTPKLVTVLRQGYGLANFRNDAVAGLTVAIVALPLAMALAIASGTTPDKGLVTAVIAGFLISALGGSRFQIGGPTGAFVVVVFNVIAVHGYDGLILATLMAGLMLIIAGFARLGTWIKYIPKPVVTGFTVGIAIIIFCSQIKDLFGLQMDSVPADFIDKWQAFWQARDSLNVTAMLVAAGALAAIIGLRVFAPKIPGFLVAVVGASLLVWLFGLPVETIGSKFGGIPSSLPLPHLPAFDLTKIKDVVPSAFTIAFLAGVESLLSAVVADGMTGGRHRSNCELVAQGIANMASALFSGLPATGAIARTATNIRSGARTPIAGIMHAVFLLIFMLSLAPLASYVPLASLAAVLIVVAWNMSEIEKLKYSMSAPPGDRLVLLLTLGLTVLVDLTVAIEVGVVLAAILFMHRMSEVMAVQQGVEFLQQDVEDSGQPKLAFEYRKLPKGVEMFSLRGPLFFGSAGSLTDMLDSMLTIPKVFILRMRNVPMIDATGVDALIEFVRRCEANGTMVLVTGVQPQPQETLRQMGFNGNHPNLKFVANFDEARQMAAEIIEGGDSEELSKE